MKPLIIFGDSHVIAYAEAARQRSDGLFIGAPFVGATHFYRGAVKIDNDQLVISKDYGSNFTKSLEAAQIPDLSHAVGRMVVSIGFTSVPLFNDVTRMNASHWSMFHRGGDTTKAYVTNGMLRRIARDAQAEILKIYEYGISHGLFVGALAAPPPSGLAKRYDKELAHDLAIYFEQPIRAYLAEHGVPIIEVVEGTLDDDGELKPEFIGQDAFHGNLAYAHLVLDKIAKVLRL